MVLSVIKKTLSQFFLETLNLEGHQNCITGSRVTAILLNGWILPIGGALSVEGLRSTGLPRLVFICPRLQNSKLNSACT